MQSSASRSRVRATPLHAEFVSKHCIDMNTLTTIHHKCAHPCTFNCCLNNCAPPPRPSLPECRPYSGDISGMTWNPRAFFARNGIKMNRRLSGVKDLSSKLEFFGPQRPLPSWTLEHPAWPAKVRDSHLNLQLLHASKSSYSDLQLLKQAMRQASKDIAHQHACMPAHTIEDKIASSMSFLRAAERGDVVGQIRGAAKYPHLAQITDPKDSFLREKPSLNVVRDHIVELSSNDVAVRLQDLKQARVANTYEYQHKKDQILVRLKKLLPGSTSGLNALEDPVTGNTVTDPQDMARLLTEHWGRILTGRPINKSLLSLWLRDLHCRLPPRQDPCWIPTHDHVLDSVKRSHENCTSS